VAVLVIVLEASLVDMPMRVHVVAVAVLVLMLGVIVIVLRVGVLMLLVPVAVAVGMGFVVSVLVLALIHVITPFRLCPCATRRRAISAEAENREVAEARLVSELAADRPPDRIELGRLDRGHPAAALAGDVLVLRSSDERIQARPVSDMNMADQPELLQLGQVAVD
jgi:hypothetical protein